MQWSATTQELARAAEYSHKVSNLALAAGAELTVDTVILTYLQERPLAIGSGVLATMVLGGSLVVKRGAERASRIVAQIESHRWNRGFTDAPEEAPAQELDEA